MAKSPLAIRDDTELAAALKRADALLDRPAKDTEAHELAELVAAIDAYTSTSVQPNVSGNPHVRTWNDEPPV